MATATKKSTSASKSTAAKSRTAKSATTKSATAKSSSGKNSASTTEVAAKKRATTRSTGTERSAAEQTAPKALLEREPRIVVEDAGYAVTGVLGDVFEVAREFPSRAEGLWKNVNTAAKDAPQRARSFRDQAPDRVESQLHDLRERLAKDTGRLLTAFEKRFDTKAIEGRKLAERVRRDERVATVLDRTGTSRSQLKAAVTSVTRTADIAVDAGREQLDTARSQAKGAVTATTKVPEAAREASREQADTARSQTKGAATSVKRTAEEISDAIS